MITELLSIFDWAITSSGMSRQPPIAQAIETVVFLLIAIRFAFWTAALVDSPLARHACRLCREESCQLCIDEARNARVDEYVTQARERRRS